MKRLAIAAAALIAMIAVAVVATAIYMRTLEHPASAWHVDPAVIERGDRPNDYLVAPEGATLAQPDRITDIRAIAARDLLFLFDSIAMNSRRTDHVAVDEDSMTITYVQRSAFFGFPDYVSVKAVETSVGAGLILWSRSRFGHSDMGVNRDRVEAWLVALGD